MSLSNRFEELAEDITMVTFSDISPTEKEKYYEDFKLKLEKLDKKFSKKENLFTKLDIFEERLSNVSARQNVCGIMLDQLKARIQKEKEDLK